MVKPSEIILPDMAPLLFFNKGNLTLLNRIIQLHAINQLFFKDIQKERIIHFNRILNIQWAIDIKNQLPN
jgi:hypothetical protein